MENAQTTPPAEQFAAHAQAPSVVQAPPVMEKLPAASDEYVRQAETKSLAFLNPKAFNAMRTFLEYLQAGSALPKDVNPGKGMMILQRGYELGMQPAEALQSIAVVNGRLSLWGDAAIAQVEKNGFEVDWGECNENTATVMIKNLKTEKVYESTYTMEMAKKRGLYKQETYAKYPDTMLRFKAFHSLAKFVASKAFHNIEIAEIAEAETEPLRISHADQSQTSTVQQTSAVSTIGAKNFKDRMAANLKAKDDAVEIEAEPEKKPARGKKAESAEEAQSETKQPAEEVKPVETVELEVVKESDEQKYARLIAEEMGGRKLDKMERMFIAKMTAQGNK